MLAFWESGRDGEFLEYEAQVGVGLGEGEHVFLRTLAVAAIVIIELDDGGLAVGVADIAIVGRIEDLLLGVLDDLQMGDALLFGLLGLECLLHVQQHLGIVDEIVADDQLDLGAVDVRRGDLLLRRIGACDLRPTGAEADGQHCDCGDRTGRAQIDCPVHLVSVLMSFSIVDPVSRCAPKRFSSFSSAPCS